ncbi:ubiquitin carboxyl-terminal hydrolase 4 isoform X1 [Achlya hypogyna]|uniref:ubiquitinyl hydrolase 1 n=1 Tax=Achlya hypogyna TaxID=1202772 RepID=A0A1V9YF01_ACHHY|nr:ubiquitin carboxyl-terminal hydrolase 4 isoform X1 [Achlya hypogyna]
MPMEPTEDNPAQRSVRVKDTSSPDNAGAIKHARSSVGSSETDDRRSEADRNTFVSVLPSAAMSSVSVALLHARFVEAVESTKSGFRLFQRHKEASRRPLDLIAFTVLFPGLKRIPQANAMACWRLFHPFDAVTVNQVVQFIEIDPIRFVFDWFTASTSFPGGKLKKKAIITRKELRLLLDTATTLAPNIDVTAEMLPEIMTRAQFAAIFPMSVLRILTQPFTIFPNAADEVAATALAPHSALQYAVVTDWWLSWQRFTASPSTQDNDDDVRVRPGSIYNGHLADALQRGAPLVEGIDFVLVAPGTWTYLRTHYSGGPALPCFHGTVASALEVYLAETDGRPSPQCRRAFVDPTQPLVVLAPSFAALHALAQPADVRLWCRDAGGAWVLVGTDLTAGDVAVPDLLLEVRAGEAWPRDRLRSARDFRPLRVGDAVDAYDCEQTWRPAVIHRLSSDGSRVLVSFVGYSTMYNEWMHHDSSKLQPRYSRADAGSDASPWPKPAARLNPGLPGAVGLVNLGNTCFLNCALQCLSATPVLRAYLLSQQFAAHVNKANDLGTKGKVVAALAQVVSALWAPPMAATAVSPAALRKLIAKSRPQFDSYDQQDAHEYIAVLLDALHEDVKRTSGFASLPPSDTGGDAAWAAHVRGNHSIVTDTFHGLLQSQTACHGCGHRSTAFDPFLFFSLPIPMVHRCNLRVLVFPQGAAPRVCDVAMPTNEGRLEAVVAAIGDQIGVAAEALRLVHVQHHRFVRVLSPDLLVCDVEGAALYCFERLARLPLARGLSVAVARAAGPNEPGAVTTVDVDSFCVELQTTGEVLTLPQKAWYASVKPRTKEGIVDLQVVHRHEGILVGVPFVLSLGSERSTAELHALVAAHLERAIAPGSPYRLAAMALSNPGRACALPSSDEPFLRFVRPPEVVVVEWTTAPPTYIADWSLVPPEAATPSLTLEMCLDTFLAQERMGDGWACERCATTSGGARSSNVARAPDVLMLHLKRFHYSSVQHHKVTELVTFPLEGLDISPYMGSPPADPNECLYDLVAVANHTGGLSEGHYTTYSRFEIDVPTTDAVVPVPHTWLCCDDEVVGELPPGKVVSNAAYVLFYKRRLPSCASQLYAL